MKNIFQKILFIMLIAVTIMAVKVDAQADSYRYWTGWSWSKISDLGYTSNPIEVTYEVKYCYEEAYKMIDLVNAERRKAGVPELEAKDELMDAAMMRAAETALYWSHTRPDGSSYRSASIFSDGENIYTGSELAQEANESLVSSPGHYATMIREKYAYAGYGYVEIYEGSMCVGSYWVQIFSTANKYYEDGFDLYHPENNKPVQWDKMTIGQRKDYTADFTAKVNPDLIGIYAVASTCETWDMEDGDEGYAVGSETVLTVSTIPRYPDYYKASKSYGGAYLSEDQYEVRVLTTDTCFYKNGKLKALKEGKGKLSVSLKADSSINTTIEFEIKDKPVKKGSKVSVSGNTYKVTSTKSRTVSFYKGKADAKKVSIPKTVKIQGKTYKVTSVAANAFKNNKKLASVTVGANVTAIGSKAFYGCKSLKKITVKSAKLKSVGKNALKGIHKKAVVKVPKSKLAKYKKLFKGKGQKKTVRIKK